MLVNVQRGRKQEEMYQLSSRTRMELEHYLTEEFPRQTDKDYECKICNELVMKVRRFSMDLVPHLCRTCFHCARADATLAAMNTGPRMSDGKLQDSNARSLLACLRCQGKCSLPKVQIVSFSFFRPNDLLHGHTMAAPVCDVLSKLIELLSILTLCSQRPWNVDDLEKIGPQATDTAYDGGSSDESDPEPPTPAPRTRRSQQRNRSDDEQPSEEEQEDGPATPGPSNSRERVRRGGSNVSRQAALDGSSGRRIRREDTLMESDQEDKPEADDLDEEVDELEEDEPPPPSTTSGRKKGRGR